MTTPGENPGSDSKELNADELQQRVTTLTAELTGLKQKVSDGLLVEPSIALQKAIEAGEVFPKERFVGLQNKVTSIQEEHKSVLDELNGKLAAVQNKASTLEINFGTASNELEALKAETTAKEKTIEDLTTKTSRTELILKEFPHLASFEAEGLLPQGVGEELQEKLGKFSTSLETLKGKAAEDFGKGGSPKEPAPKEDGKVPASETLKAEMFNAALRGDTPTYNEKYEAYLQAAEAEKAG